MNYIILYGGKLCESRLVSSQGDCTLINFYAHYGTELPDRDSGLFAGHSDPYVRVIAYHSRGSSKSLQKSYSVRMMAVQNRISGLTLVWIVGQDSLFRFTMNMTHMTVHCQV